MSDWYEIENIEEIDSPALVVFPERITENIKEMIRVAGDPASLQPHVKTYKMAEVVKMQMDHGIDKFKYATIAEGEMLGMVGVRSALMAYQPIGPKVKRLLQLVQKFPKTIYAALVDNLMAAKGIASIFENENLVLNVYIDLDVGMHRTGISADEKALELFLECQKLNGINPVGLHVYDGHVRDADLSIRKQKCDESFKAAERLAFEIEKQTGQKLIIIAGGSPTFPIHAKREGVLKSPGTCLLWDWGYATLFPDQNFQYAALVICRIISIVENDKICVDLGHKSVAAEKPFPRVHFLNLPNASQIAQSEEHLVLDVGDNKNLEVGMVLYGVPKHICPTCALYEKAYIVGNGKVNTSWKVIARDRQIQI